MILTLPLPPRELSPNARPHWSTRARRVRQYREDCGWLGTKARLEHGRLQPPVHLSVTFFFANRRKHDPDNCVASLKAGLDGLVDSGLLAADDAESLVLDGVKVAFGRPRVLLELRSSPSELCGGLEGTASQFSKADPGAPNARGSSE